jgi:hypothetical protein
MANLYPDIRKVEEVLTSSHVIWYISIFIVPLVSQNRNACHSSCDAMGKDL